MKMSSNRKILIVSATQKEIEQTMKLLQKNCEQNITKFDFLITGVGITNTIFSLTDLLKDFDYQLVINIGICGAYNKRLELGQVVEVIEDCFADQYIEKEDKYFTWSEVGITCNTKFPYTENGKLLPSCSISKINLKKVAAITSDTVHASNYSIKNIEKMLSPDIETMEGAAVFYACRKFNMKALQIRAISNYAGTTDRNQWKTELAIENLSKVLNDKIIPQVLVTRN